MTITTEERRVDLHVAGEEPAPVHVQVFGTGPWGCVERIREVMRIVARQRGAGWPDEAWWQQNLPRWFVATFEGHTVEELLADPALWHFGSWVDAMKEPGWVWWSSQANPDQWSISLQALADPYSLGPLEYLARAAGALDVGTHEA